MNRTNQRPLIPSPDDFISAFGCESSIESDTFLQECIFNDENGKRLQLTFGFLDNSFSIFLYNGEDLDVSIRSDYLNTVSINNENIYITFINNGKDLKFSIQIWPRITISMVNLS